MESKDLDSKAAVAAKEKQQRDRSTIAFPYMDLDNAISLAMVVHAKFGGSGHLDSLADALGHAGTNSGTFQMKLAAARVFGLVETDRMKIVLTPLGQRVVQPHLQAQARVDAFMTVPLYSKIFNEYRGRQLPQDEGLESFIKQSGVAPKQADKARMVLKRAAEQAGVLSASKDRLIMPAFASGATTISVETGAEMEPTPTAQPSFQQGVTGVDLSKHPAISAFLLTMPPDGWTLDEITEWINHFKGVVTTVYKVRQKDSSSTEKQPPS